MSILFRLGALALGGVGLNYKAAKDLDDYNLPLSNDSGSFTTSNLFPLILFSFAVGFWLGASVKELYSKYKSYFDHGLNLAQLSLDIVKVPNIWKKKDLPEEID